MQDERRRTERERAAYHEAGHAVVARQRGLPPAVVVLGLGQDEGTGWCAHASGPLEDVLVTAMGGIEAEVVLNGSFEREMVLRTSEAGATAMTDLTEAIHTLRSHGLDHAGIVSLVGYASEEAERIVRAEWRSICELAERLLAAPDGLVAL